MAECMFRCWKAVARFMLKTNSSFGLLNFRFIFGFVVTFKGEISYVEVVI